MANSSCKCDIAMTLLFNMGVSVASWTLSTIREHLIRISQIFTLLD